MKRSNPQSPPTISKNMHMLEQTHVRQGSREEYRGADREKAERALVVAYLERVEYAYES